MNSLTHGHLPDLLSTFDQSDRYYQYGDLDGLLGSKANKEFWFSKPEYKQGYLNGTARRIENELNGLDMGVAAK